ncbi:SPFH domain-containing protein [Candidatus Dojkabacteria bacterium]|nr:SPFH domain-containing protein [Candidatus Dojkabacteria bacterium]
MPLGILGFILLLIVLSNIRQVNQYEKGLLFDKGKFSRIVEPGWIFVFPIFQSLRKIDSRIKTVELTNLEAMSKDNVSIVLGIVLYYKIEDAAKSILNVENSQWATSQLAESTMRTVVGEFDLNQLLSSRESVAEKIQLIIDKTVDEWGIDIKSVELKDISLPSNMKRTMAKQAEAEREKVSIIMKSEGELLAAQNLSDAAKTLAEAPGALHLRTLSTVNDVSSDQSNTIIFMIPIEVLRALEGFGTNKNTGSSEDLGNLISSVVKKKDSK